MKFVISPIWTRRIRYVYIAIAIIYSGISTVDRIVHQRIKYGRKNKRSRSTHAQERARSLCKADKRLHHHSEENAEDAGQASQS